MKRYISAIMILILFAFSFSLPSYAAEDNYIVETIQAVGIMKGDSNGNLNLDKYVTRAEFATMMTRASKYKDNVAANINGFSMFKDVRSNHWASGFIQIAVQEGWFAGYTDGTFRPDNNIKIEEACTALLNLLGYDSSTLIGSFPHAQLNKALSVGLRDNVNVAQGNLITRGDCVQLFYNLLISESVSGTVYGTTLGYSITNDKVDYTAIVLKNLEGPYIADVDTVLNFEPQIAYKDGKTIDSFSLNKYDVYYYNEGLKTVWVYSDRIAGKITSMSPNNLEPNSVTIAGNTYAINDSKVKYELSTLTGKSSGEIVTLLLGMNDDVVGIITGEDVETTYYGIVKDSSRELLTEENAHFETSVTIYCTDGITRTFSIDRDVSYDAGDLLTIDVEKGEVNIKRLSEKSITGKINKTGTKLGDYSFADNIKIIDTTDEGDSITVSTDRLAGISLNSRSSVRYYALNEDEEIEHLILENVTGDTWSYAYLSDMIDLSVEMNLNVIYTYLLNGKPVVLNASGVKYPVKVGGIGISYKSDGSIKSMRQMDSIKITDLGVETVKSNNKTYTLADSIQVYLRDGGDYYLTDLASVNENDYNLTGWYDTASGGAGGLVRIIIANEK